MPLRGLVWALTLVSTATGCALVPEPEVGLACQITPDATEDFRQAAPRPELVGKTPQQAVELLEEAGDDPGLPVTWRYHYKTDPANPNVGYSECWCIVPPDGRVIAADVTEFGQLLIMVERSQAIVGGRPQPRLGWGCEDEARSTPNRSIT